MSTGTDYFSVLPVEIISAIIYFQDYEDREKCCLLSKRLYSIYKSARTQFRLELNASTPTSVRVNSFVDREKLDVTLRVYDHVNEASLEACFRNFRVCELRLIECRPSTLNGFISLFIRNITVSYMDLDLNSLKALPTLAPNLEYLEVLGFQEGLFTGTESFKNLKTLAVRSLIGTNLLPAVSSIAKKMPSLTGLIVEIGFSEISPDFFVAPSNLEYIEILLADPVPISASNVLTQLHVHFLDEFITMEDDQPAPLSNVEIFGFFGYEINLYPIMQYYGIGDNLKTICLEMYDLERADTERIYREDKPLDELFIEDQLWKSCSNLEYLLTMNDVQVKSLVHVASICTKLRLVSFNSFLEDNGEFNTQLLSKTGIKDIFLCEKLLDEELQFLLDSGIEVVYDSERFSYPYGWPKRRYPSL